MSVASVASGRMGDGQAPPRPADLPPGYDEADPYEDADLAEFPEWWRTNVELFREHEMRPYRPPRFADGVVTTEVIDRLEAELGVSIRLRSVDPQGGGGWKIWVDGDPVVAIDRTRTRDGNSRYEISSSAFESLVRDAVERGD